MTINPECQLKDIDHTQLYEYPVRSLVADNNKKIYIAFSNGILKRFLIDSNSTGDLESYDCRLMIRGLLLDAS